MAYIPQNYEDTRKTVFDTILLGRRPYIKWDVDKNDVQLVENIIKTLDLESFSMRYTDELSGGELQVL